MQETPMKPDRSALAMLEENFLELRHRVLDVAAALDRIHSASNPKEARADARLEHLSRALAIVSDSDQNKAERVQLEFSVEYSADWRDD